MTGTTPRAIFSEVTSASVPTVRGASTTANEDIATTRPLARADCLGASATASDTPIGNKFPSPIPNSNKPASAGTGPRHRRHRVAWSQPSRHCQPTAFPGPHQHDHSWCRHHPRPIPGDAPSASGIPRRGRSGRIRLAKRDRRSMCTQRRGGGRAAGCTPAGDRRAARRHRRHERPASGRSRPRPSHRRPNHPRRRGSDRMGRRTRGEAARTDHRRAVPTGPGLCMRSCRPWSGTQFLRPILDDRPPSKHKRRGPMNKPKLNSGSSPCGAKARPSDVRQLNHDDSTDKVCSWT